MVAVSAMSLFLPVISLRFKWVLEGSRRVVGAAFFKCNSIDLAKAKSEASIYMLLFT